MGCGCDKRREWALKYARIARERAKQLFSKKSAQSDVDRASDTGATSNDNRPTEQTS